MKDTEILNQLVKALEESVVRLELAYKRKNFEEFNTTKKFIIQIKGKFSEALQ